MPRVRYYTPVMKTKARAAGNIVEELTRNGASTLIDLAVKAGLADTLTGMFLRFLLELFCQKINLRRRPVHCLRPD